MSIRKLLILGFTLILCLQGTIAFVMSLLSLNQREVAAAEQRRYASYKLADELRQSSTDLTRMARLYVVTGDAEFEAHFNTILWIRDGELPRPVEYDGTFWD